MLWLGEDKKSRKLKAWVEKHERQRLKVVVVWKKLALGGEYPLNIYSVGICTRPRLWSPELLAAVSFHLNIGDSGAGHMVPFKEEDVKSQARLR